MSEPLRPGDPHQLGDYYLDGRLGSGGQGVVYEGFGPDGARVAVKVLRRVSDADLATFDREIRAWRRVEPFCTTKVLHADLSGPLPYVVSEYVPGRDLGRDVWEKGPFGPENVRRLALGVATALVAVHRAGVVHRDLKPENILLGPDGPRVIDFGIARIEEPSDTTAVVMGSLRYMPPERYRRERGDAKVDIWGWGAVVLFAATGHDAFDGATLDQLRDQIEHRDPDTSALDEPLRGLVRSALAKDPAGRPTSEQLLLTLAGRADLAEVVDQTVPVDRSVPSDPSRAEKAERVFGELGAGARDAVPRIMLRMVAGGEQAEDALRSASRAEFVDESTGAELAGEVLDAFIGADVLVRRDDGAVTLHSAALLRSWVRLGEWVRADRDGLAVHHDLTVAARRWDENGRKPGDLYQGSALARALSWLTSGRVHLAPNHAERAFLNASLALSQRRGRVRTVLTAVLAALLVLAVSAAAIAFDQRQTIAGQRDRAASAQVAGLAQTLRRSNPELARRLAVAAEGLAATPQSWSALLALRHQAEAGMFRLPDFAFSDARLDAAGRVLAAAGGGIGQGSVRVEFWDLDARRRISAYAPPKATVNGVALSADGRTAAVSTKEDGLTRLVDTATGRLRDGRTYPSARGQYGPTVSISPLGTYLLIGELTTDSEGRSQRVLGIWDTRRPKKIITVSGGFADLNASFSPDERIVSLPASSGKGRPFTWYDTHTKKKITAPRFDLDGGEISGPVVFSPDGLRVAVKIGKGDVRVHNLQYGYNEIDLDTPLEDGVFGFAPDGRHAVFNGRLWRLSSSFLVSGQPILNYSTTQGECRPDAGFRLSADSSEMRCVGEDGAYRSLDISALTKAKKLGTESLYTQGGFTEDGSTVGIATTSTTELWSLRTHTLRATWDGAAHQMSEALFNRDATMLAGLAADHSAIEIWDVNNKSRLGRLTTPLNGEPLERTTQTMAFSPDGKSLAFYVVRPNGKHSLTFWNLTTMKKVYETTEQIGCYSALTAILGTSEVSLTFRPDGGSVLAAPCFGLVEHPSGRLVRTKGPVGAIVDAVSRDGTTFYTFPRGGAPWVRFWDARTLRPKGEDLRTGPVSATDASGTALSPDGGMVATVHQTGPLIGETYQIKLWDVRSRTQLGVPLTGSIGEITALAFSPDGKALTSVDKNGRINVHDIARTRLVRALCSQSGRLSKREWQQHIPDIPYRKSC
ncbi:protein kinase [Actinomadura sp. 1N219]|uniref:protein kinase domain-containing protein n=1 Tax=Actinomadura sp. 1N219 TaxID=3375152 RepID=UPI0037A1F256